MKAVSLARFPPYIQVLETAQCWYTCSFKPSSECDSDMMEYWIPFKLFKLDQSNFGENFQLVLPNLNLTFALPEHFAQALTAGVGCLP